MNFSPQTASTLMPQQHPDRTRLALSWIGGVLLCCAALLSIAYACFDYSQGEIRLSSNSYLRVQGPWFDLILPMAGVCVALGATALIYSRLRRAG